jgi:hypothetical protein
LETAFSPAKHGEATSSAATAHNKTFLITTAPEVEVKKQRKLTGDARIELNNPKHPHDDRDHHNPYKPTVNQLLASFFQIAWMLRFLVDWALYPFRDTCQALFYEGAAPK